MKRTEAPRESDVAVAGIARRAAAGCVDGGILLAALLRLSRGYHNAGLWSGLPNEALWFYPVGGALIAVTYLFVPLAVMRSTPGMLLFGLALADSAGDRPSLWQVVVRVLVSFLSAGALGLGYAWALFQRRRQTWHDLAADTIVVHGRQRARGALRRPPPRRTGERTYDIG
jgi:uncharacterized RDD family membrane protein YckC